ncbi:MAG: hypothetical protein HGA75_01975 [Thiobacillus sp.]|nr:hypothetical protein [Thiobacillus sp.]
MYAAIKSISLASLTALFCLPFLLPLHTAPLPAFHAEWLAAVFGLLAALGLLSHPAQSIRIPRAAFLPAGLAVLLLVDSAIRENASFSGHMLAVLYLSLSLTVMLATSTLSATLGRPRLMASLGWAVLVGGLASSLIAVAQHWNIDTPFSGLIAAKLSDRDYGNLAQSNHLAAQLAIALAALAALFSTRRLNWPNGIVFATILLLGLSLSGSRSAWLYLAAILALAIAYKHQSKSEPAGRFMLLAFAMLAIFIALQLLLAHAGITPQTTTGTTAETVTASTRLSASPSPFEVRATLWRDAIMMFLDHPLAGVGYQGFSWHFFLIEATSPNPLYWLDENHVWSNCHNLPLQLLAELGLGAALLLLLFGYWLFRTYRHIRTPEQCGVLAMLAMILIHSLVEYPLYYLYFLLPAAALMALASEETWHVQVSGPLLKLTNAALLLVGTVVMVQMQSDYRVIEAIHSQTGSRPGKLDHEQLTKLAALQQDSLLSAQADELINQLAVSLDKPITWQPLSAIGDRVMRQETAATHVFRQIYLLILTGRHGEATALLEKAKYAYPYAYRDFRSNISRIGKLAPDNQNIRGLLSYMDR